MSEHLIFDFDWFRGFDLPEEDSIMANWDQQSEPPLVSVLCITYNHRKFIHDALRGILIQRTSFPFEILVHDDASDDGTTDIVREYAERYPNIVKPIVQLKNQFSKGKRPTPLSLPFINGRYVALCEGDDFWFSDTKLQRQADELENHPQSVMAGHGTYTYETSDGRLSDNRWSFEDQIDIDLKLQSHKLSRLHTSSLMLRRSELEESVKQLGSLPTSDSIVRLLMSLKGHVIYLADVMSVYRKGVPDSWTVRLQESDTAISNFYLQLERLQHLEKIAGTGSKKEIKSLKESQIFSLLHVLRARHDFHSYLRFSLMGMKFFTPRSFVKLFVLTLAGSERYSRLAGNR